MSKHLLSDHGPRTDTAATRNVARRVWQAHGAAAGRRTEDKRLAAPGVRITNPIEGQELVEGDRILIEASATDIDRITKVIFFVDGEAVGIDETPPYNVSYRVPTDATFLVFEAEVWDAEGKVVAAPSVAVTVVPDPMTGFVGRVGEGGDGVKYRDDEVRLFLSTRNLDVDMRSE